jgi:hypothetical protein
MVEYIALGNGFFGIEGCLFCLRFVFVNDLRFLLLRVLSSTIEGRDIVYSDRLNSKRKWRWIHQLTKHCLSMKKMKWIRFLNVLISSMDVILKVLLSCECVCVCVCVSVSELYLLNITGWYGCSLFCHFSHWRCSC